MEIEAYVRDIVNQSVPELRKFAEKASIFGIEKVEGFGKCKPPEVGACKIEARENVVQRILSEAQSKEASNCGLHRRVHLHDERPIVFVANGSQEVGLMPDSSLELWYRVARRVDGRRGY